MNMLQDLRDKNSTVAPEGAEGVPEVAIVAAAVAAVYPVSGEAKYGDEAKYCDECYVESEDLETDPDYPDTKYCQACWAQWRGGGTPLPPGSAVASPTPSQAGAAQGEEVQGAAVEGAAQGEADTADPAAPTSEQPSPATSPQPPATTAQQPQQAGAAQPPAPGQPGQPTPQQAQAGQPPGPHGGSRDPWGDAQRQELAAQQLAAAAAAAQQQQQQHAAQGRPAQQQQPPPAHAAQSQPQKGQPQVAQVVQVPAQQGQPVPGQPPVNANGQPAADGSAPQMNPNANPNANPDAFMVNNAWNVVPSELGMMGHQPNMQVNNNVLWPVTNADELGAAAAWSSVSVQLPGGLWGGQQQGGGAPHAQQHPGQASEAMDMLSNQLFQAIVKDGTDATTAEKVMRMLMNLPQEGVQNCIADPALRSRMVMRCVNDMNGVA